MTPEVNPEPEDKKIGAAISVAKFLEKVPPGELRALEFDAFRYSGSRPLPIFHWATIELYCSNSKCAGFRFADPDTERVLFDFGTAQHLWCAYACRNCKQTLKLYGMTLTAPASREQSGIAIKIGEYPLFGPHLPAGVLELLGEDKDYFLKGHRSEAQGLGIGAFSYYRRVVESQRTRIFDEIISAAEHVGAPRR